MRLFLCTTVLSTVLLGALAYPADPSVPQPQKVGEGEKQLKQNLFGIGIDLNLSKNGTLIPTPAFINTSASYGTGIGAGGNFIVPLVPFPLGLLFPHPPLNITVGFSANKNISAGLVASTGNATIEEQIQDSGWGWQPAPTGWGWPTTTTPAPSGWGWSTTTTPPSGWGWSTTTSTAAPSGWGWSTTTTTPAPSGWGWTPPETTTTQGWSPPPTTQGWNPPPPPTTPGWSPPETTTTQGWGWVETTTPGWGWGPVRKGVSANSSPLKPQSPAGPKPNAFNKPNGGDIANKPVESASGSPNNYIADVAESNLSSELPLPSVEVPVQAEPLHVAEAIEHAPPPQMIQVAEVMEQAPPAQVAEAVEQVAHLPPPMINQDDIPMPVEMPVAEMAPVPVPELMDDLSKKVSVPVSPNSGKSKRHAGVERPSALRIEDFEDVESPNEMSVPAMQEQMEQQEMSKEEMIIMAMEQNSVAPGGAPVQLGNARPAPLRPTLNQLQAMNKPSAEDDDDSPSAVDLRNAEAAAAAQLGEPSGVSKSVSKGKPEAEPSNNGERGGRNKPRPYGMDKPSKSRPTLDSGMKDKTEQFGLPHYSSDLVQKEQFQLPSGASVLGWQVPDIKWSSFANIFQNFMGSRHKNSMGKSDAAVDKCMDDEDVVVVRSPNIQGGRLCQSSTASGSSCHDACVKSGFAGGNCLGPYPTPGCLCRMPNHKELGMMLSPLKAPVEENREELMASASAPCKKCACADACKKTGSYTGFCIDRCYCAVPWYTKGA